MSHIMHERFSGRPRGARPRVLALVLASLLGAGGSAGVQAASGPVLGCDGASIQQVVGTEATVVSAQSLTTASGGLPYCRVDGHLTTSGPALTTNRVRFMVSMPMVLENRYYFQGLGGSAGYIPAPPENLLAAGYAFATTDGGSPTPGVNWMFAIDRTKAEDWDKRGGHLSAQITQKIVRAYYGMSEPLGQLVPSERLYRYHSGCSGGGRMGIVAASWFPEDFDGVVAGAPGINPLNVVLFGKIAKHLLTHPDAWISPEEIKALEDRLVERFDGADGQVDGVIADPSKVVLDDVLLAPLSDAQRGTLRMVTEGIAVAGASYPGLSVANPLGWSAFLLGSASPAAWGDLRQAPAGLIVFDTTSRGLFGPTYNFVASLDFDDPAQVAAWLQKYREVFVASGSTEPSNLKRFVRKGGKVLFWHGTADNAISLADTERFFQRLTRRNGVPGGASAASLYFVPGIQHCGGGFGPQDVPDRALEALARWVEQDERPGALVGQGKTPDGAQARSYRLCSYPQKARLINKKLDVNNAANWVCASK